MIFQLVLFQNELGTTIFERIANTCYDMLDHQNSYQRFLAAMKLLHVPVQTPSMKTDIQPTAVTTGLQITVFHYFVSNIDIS